jgi:predicted lipoprotein with Yx(FWY)xxD motif
MTLRTALLTTVVSSLALNACAGSYSTNTNDDAYSADDAYETVQVAKADTIVTKVSTKVGEVFADKNGMTLYVFTKDAASKSNCYGGCAANWPPFMAKKNAKTWGAFTVIERTDDSYQWAYNGQPLYTWVGDQNPSDVNGHGVSNVWFAAETP